jgi:hypothetical protein
MRSAHNYIIHTYISECITQEATKHRQQAAAAAAASGSAASSAAANAVAIEVRRATLFFLLFLVISKFVVQRRVMPFFGAHKCVRKSFSILFRMLYYRK